MPGRHTPDTIALIPDGNRRWARRNRLSILKGYSLGVTRFVDFCEWCLDYGVKDITVWALSTENLKRSKAELAILFKIYKDVANDGKMLDMLRNNRARLKLVGDMALLPKDVYRALHKLETQTKQYTERTINMMIGYGGREDIVFAAMRLASEVKKGLKNTAENFQRMLVSYSVPDVDLIIRTSGERRLSGFIPWQSYHSELYFSKKLWPDFTKRDLKLALLDYEKRERRFGK